MTLESDGFEGTVSFTRNPQDPAIRDPGSVEPAWGRYVAAVAAGIPPSVYGLMGRVTTTIPVGAGLSSSAALEVAVAIALAVAGDPVETALICQRAEQIACGVPCGLMDQLTSLAGVAGHALLIDFRTLAVEPVPLPPDLSVVIVHSGQERELATSAYAERREQLEAAQRVVGPLRDASPGDLDAIADPVVRARARHVVTENARVLRFADALRSGDLSAAGALMVEAHASFRDDFEASTPVVDALVDRLVATPGVYGARLTGGGFGGCVVALVEPGTPTDDWGRHWVVEASDGAWIEWDFVKPGEPGSGT